MAEPHHRVAAIDGLRAVAVLFVIAYHLHPAVLPGGFVGVDVFFVISGYVVCGSLLRMRSASFVTLLGSFYTRRLLRIYPALVVTLVVTGVFSRMFIPHSYLAG